MSSLRQAGQRRPNSSFSGDAEQAGGQERHRAARQGVQLARAVGEPARASAACRPPDRCRASRSAAIRRAAHVERVRTHVEGEAAVVARARGRPAPRAARTPSPARRARAANAAAASPPMPPPTIATLAACAMCLSRRGNRPLDCFTSTPTGLLQDRSGSIPAGALPIRRASTGAPSLPAVLSIKATGFQSAADDLAKLVRGRARRPAPSSQRASSAATCSTWTSSSPPPAGCRSRPTRARSPC